jgi:hypothetical protein
MWPGMGFTRFEREKRWLGRNSGEMNADSSGAKAQVVRLFGWVNVGREGPTRKPAYVPSPTIMFSKII